MKHLFFIVLILIVLISVGAVRRQLLNPDFEDDIFSNSFIGKIPSNWTGSQLFLVRNIDTAWGGGLAPKGDKYVALQGFVSIKQIITLPSYHTANITFYARTRPGFDANAVTVSFNDVSLRIELTYTS